MNGARPGRTLAVRGRGGYSRVRAVIRCFGMRQVASGLRITVLVALAVLLVGPPAPVPKLQAQEPPLATVLARMTSYVDGLHERLVGVVMEEEYEQRVAGGFTDRGPGRVTLRSDYLLVRIEGSVRPYGFRDVFEVNGRAVRDREERLTQLFLSPTVTMNRQIEGILRDSARYNIGDVQRTTNTPTLPLLFVTSAYRPRFEFERVDESSPQLDMEAPEDAPGVWVIGYREASPGTVIRRRGGADMPAEGRYWVEPETGRVLLTELLLTADRVNSIITTRYAENETMGHSVPVEMRERYINWTRRQRVNGTAVYSRFRRFQVRVEEGGAPVRD